MYRVLDVDKLYRGRILFGATPSLLNPSSVKIVYSRMLRNFWDGLGQAGVLNFGMAVIGLSLPQQDDYARQVIYRLVRNYQEHCYLGAIVLRLFIWHKYAACRNTKEPEPWDERRVSHRVKGARACKLQRIKRTEL
jgi:hypothetical protein